MKKLLQTKKQPWMPYFYNDDIGRIMVLQLFLSRLSFLSAAEKKLLKKNLDTDSRLGLLSIKDMSLMLGRALKVKVWQPEKLLSLVQRDIQLMKTYRIGALFLDDPLRPLLLDEIYDPPYALFYRGDSAILSRPAIAIVGTRRPSINGLQKTRSLAAEIAEAGYTIVSGLALGTDAAAHRGAIEMPEGLTVAVLGSGLDTISPVSNRRLGGAILVRGGCLVSEYPPAETAQKWHFPQRNRIISALSSAVVVMEAPPGSGALITADFALEHNRELFFHECALQYEQAYLQESRQNDIVLKKKTPRRVSQYIEEGALTITKAEDVFASLEMDKSLAQNQKDFDFES